jgi:zinc transport system substrate-binding protein
MRGRGPFAAVIAALLLLPQAGFAGELFPRVLVSIPVLKPYVDTLLVGVGSSDSLLGAGQDPHHFALAPSQSRMLAEADILIVPDLSINPFLKRTIANHPKLLVIELSTLEGAEPLPLFADNPWLNALRESGTQDDHSDTKEDNKPVNDPHLWLDPERMAAIALPLAQRMAERTPEMRPTYEANARAVATHLRRDVIPQLARILTPRERNAPIGTKPVLPFITYHAAYQYFLERFGITHHGQVTLRPEETLGAKTTRALLARAAEVNIRCIITEHENVIVKQLAKQSGARVIRISPEQLVDRKTVDALPWLTNDYDRFLYRTAMVFGDCL